MNNKLLLLFLFCLISTLSISQDINYNPKSLNRDVQKLWEKNDIRMLEIEIPDSMYNTILLDKGKIFSIYSENNNLGFTYVGRIYSCRSGGCGMEDPNDLVTANDDFEYFDYFIIFNTSLSVEKIRVFNYQATHGHEISGKGWLKQFVGYAGETKLEYGKNIDSISGATISANAITYNVQESSKYLALLKPIFSETKQDLNVQITE